MGDAGVVHEHVDAAVPVEGRGDGALAIRGQSHVAGDRDRVAQLAGKFDVLLDPSRGKHDRSPGRVKHLGETAAEPRRRTRDQRDATVEPKGGDRIDHDAGQGRRCGLQAVEAPERVLNGQDLRARIPSAIGQRLHHRGPEQSADRLGIRTDDARGRHHKALDMARKRCPSSPGAVSNGSARSSMMMTLPPGRSAARALRRASTGRGRSCRHSKKNTTS